jgi:nitrite reductase/ring-hydroxylating ferredoxin subunit
MAWTTLCELDDLSEGEGTFVDLDGRELAVFLHEGQAHVLDNLCPHAGGSMASGYIEDYAGDACAVCPWHGWAFRLADGQYADMPGFELKKYPSRVSDEDGRKLVQADLPMP